MSTENNYAFIDGQNLHSGIGSDGWKLDHKKFRDYLEKDLGVSKAYIFIGFMEEQQSLYNALQEAGFILFFKPLIRHEDGVIKGNVDADMVLQCMIDIDRFDKAVIVSGDGDFAGLIRHLVAQKKLQKVLLPNKNTYSSLFKRMDEFGNEYFGFMHELKNQLAYRAGGKRRDTQRPTSQPKNIGPLKDKPLSNKGASTNSENKAPASRNTPPTSSVVRTLKKKKFPSKKQAEARLLNSIEQSNK